jgi:hypothetical protein
MMTDVLERGQGTIPVPSRVPQRGRSTMWIALAGALAYSSWPLAFLVNPSLAGSALASSFEGHSQPFSWLFILLDCVAGLCTATVSICELRPRRGRQRPSRALVFALLGLRSTIEAKPSEPEAGGHVGRGRIVLLRRRRQRPSRTAALLVSQTTSPRKGSSPSIRTNLIVQCVPPTSGHATGGAGPSVMRPTWQRRGERQRAGPQSHGAAGWSPSSVNGVSSSPAGARKRAGAVASGANCGSRGSRIRPGRGGGSLIATAVPGLSRYGSPRMMTSSGAPSSMT